MNLNIDRIYIYKRMGEYMRLIIEATKEMMYCAQKSDEWCIIDARNSDAYIGWKRKGEIAGHIPYAKLFSAEWLDKEWRESRDDYEVLLELQLESQKITPEKNIIIYAENETDTEAVCDYMQSKGISKLFYYNLKNWAGDLFKYPNYRLMAPVWLVNDMLEGRTEYSGLNQDFKIFEIAWKEPSQTYLEHHIPGAVHIDSNEFELSPQWIMSDDKSLAEFARKNGITKDTTVITYGNDSLNFSAAAKLAVVLRYLGIKNVMCLNGTLKNWIAKGYPTEKGNVPKAPCDHNEEYILNRSHALHMDAVKEILTDPLKGTVIDIRNWEEYIGEDSGYDYLDKAGRIPGTKWCYYPRMYISPTNQIGNLDVMLGVWEAAGIDLKRTMAFFCGSASWGASVLKTFANVAGFDNATIYEGGWCEWCDYPDNPIESGIPEELKDYDPQRFSVLLPTEGGCHVM